MRGRRQTARVASSTVPFALRSWAKLSPRSISRPPGSEASAETDRLVQLSGDLLLIAVSDRGRVPLKREPLRADELLESVRNRFAWRAGQAGRALEVHAPEGAMLDGDRLRLEQALGNLVDNALRHGEGCVRVEARHVDSHVRLSVSDGGRGFDRAFEPRAFDRFTRGDESHSGAGAGLGLAIVDAIARAHGGHASIGGDAGRRTEVTLELRSRYTGAAWTESRRER